jgi:hypothetical protein
MRRAIAAYAVVACLVLLGVDRLWPIWPVHAVTGTGAVVVLALAGLAAVAARRR